MDENPRANVDHTENWVEADRNARAYGFEVARQGILATKFDKVSLWKYSYKQESASRS